MASNLMSIGLHRVVGLVPSSSSQEAQFLPALKLPIRKRNDGLPCSSFVGIRTAMLHCRQRLNVAGCLSSKGNTNGGLRQYTQRISAVSAPIAAEPYPLGSAEERALLAEEFGFRQIGEPIPKGVALKNVIDNLPSEVFQINPKKAWTIVAITLTAYAAKIFMITESPWYLLPLAWAWTGTTAAWFFFIGQDCAHKAFSKNKLVEDIVGIVAFMPLISPYEPWRFKHDRHHAKTNMLVEDTAWHPIMREEWETFPGFVQKGLEFAMGPLCPWALIGHWLMWHFDLRKYRLSEQNRVKINLATVFGFMAIAFPTIIYFTGITSWVKYLENFETLQTHSFFFSSFITLLFLATCCELIEHLTTSSVWLSRFNHKVLYCASTANS